MDIVNVDEDSGEANLGQVVGLNRRISISNNTFTCNLIKLALKDAIEAAYELAYEVPEDWQLVYTELPLPMFSGINSKVYKTDDASVPEDKFNVLEVLQLFTPGIWEILDRRNSLVFTESVKQNYDFYSDPNRIVSGEDTRPVNLLLKGIAAGLVMNREPNYLTTFMTHLGTFISENISGYWSQMKKDVRILNRRPDGLPFDDSNSLTTNCMFLSLILQGVLQMRIVGGVSASRFYYEDMRIVGVGYATMPSYWNTVSVVNYGIGNNKGTLDVRQNAYDSQYETPNVGGAFIVNGDFSLFTP